MSESNQQLTCPVCGEAAAEPYASVHDVEYFTSQATFQYVRCTGCDSILLVDPPVAELSRIYPPNYYSFQPEKKTLVTWVKASIDKRLFRWCLSRLPDRPLAVLDVGGGVGDQLDVLRSLDRRIEKTMIVDLDSTAEVTAKSRGHMYFHGRIEDFTPPTRYDLILALNLIEHVADPGAVLIKLKECLTSDGMLLLKTPNIDSLDARLFKDRNWGGFHCPRHFVLFDKRSLLALAEKTGLKTKVFKYTQGAPFWSVSCLAGLRRVGLVRIDSAHPAFTHPLYKLFLLIFGAFDVLRSPFAKTSQMFCILERAHSDGGENSSRASA